MIGITENISKHFLYPSNLFVSKERHYVTTILGSCVAICLYNKKYQFGGINHYMLPLWNGEGLASPRYGNIANDKLYEKMKGLGSLKEHLVAKVFGGANQIQSTSQIGQKNIQIAMDMMSDLGIPVVAQSVGGTIGRKIIFDTYTGGVKMKYVKKES
ncbi:MAG: chemotaxis protein CheD [Cyclobacteriaceae bacterium]|nr:chemotaxis protein CheD [Cyclobacteriaceae bacterium]